MADINLVNDTDAEWNAGQLSQVESATDVLQLGDRHSGTPQWMVRAIYIYVEDGRKTMVCRDCRYSEMVRWN